MLSIKFIRDEPEKFDSAMRARGETVLSFSIIKLDEQVRAGKTMLQNLQNRRNQIAKQIGVFKSQRSDIPQEILNESEAIKQQLPAAETALANQEAELQEIMMMLPNMPECSVPFGEDENSNLLIRQFGSIPTFAFKPKAHFELGEAAGLMNFADAAQMSGSRFVILKKELALLERALTNFMLDHNIGDFGYTEVSPPYLVHESAMLGAGQLPKFAAESFKTLEGFRLIPTAEVPLTNLVADRILNSAELPLRMTAHTPCFRSEAGSAGRDTRGMLRQHQFHKVELVSIVEPEDSQQELERMVSVAESILQKLNLPYRVMLLCSQDMGFAAQKTYDIEVWMPGQERYREISSCSNCGEFQARRMKARYRDSSGNIRYLHMLNGSALAVGRLIIAIMENYQLENGDIAIPKALQSYMRGIEIIQSRH